MCKSVCLMQEGELNQADKYAEVALQADRFNPSGEFFTELIDVCQDVASVLMLCIDRNHSHKLQISNALLAKRKAPA